MSEPVTIQLKLSDVENLLDAATVCAEDLSTELDERYNLRDRVPTQQRRWENDMAYVNRLIACISTVKISIPT